VAPSGMTEGGAGKGKEKKEERKGKKRIEKKI
jgi:hypothetical protein